jgi:hypothetical protein
MGTVVGLCCPHSCMSVTHHHAYTSRVLQSIFIQSPPPTTTSTLHPSHLHTHTPQHSLHPPPSPTPPHFLHTLVTHHHANTSRILQCAFIQCLPPPSTHKPVQFSPLHTAQNPPSSTPHPPPPTQKQPVTHHHAYTSRLLQGSFIQCLTPNLL